MNTRGFSVTEAVAITVERLETEDSKKYILEKPEYALLKKALTLAFKKGYKTPGRAIRQILDVYIQSNGKE